MPMWALSDISYGILPSPIVRRQPPTLFVSRRLVILIETVTMTLQDAIKHSLIAKHGTMQTLYADDWLNIQSAYEVAYYHEYGTLPEDAVCIDSVIVEANGVATFLHRDLSKQ